MNKKNSIVARGVVLAFLLAGMPTVAQANEQGMILGNVYDFDGISPIKGAVVKITNTATGSEFQSTTSDKQGTFSILGVESGIYQYTVSLPGGDYVADSVFGVKMDGSDTARVAINVTSYEKLDSAVANMPAPKTIEGESFIGRVVNFDRATGKTDVFVMQGTLSKSDKIHALGETTDFYQKVNAIRLGDNEASSAIPGETATIMLNEASQVGDAVYLKSSKGGILPVLLAPIGVAAIAAGSAAVAYNVGVNQTNEEFTATSGFRTDSIKKKKKIR